LAPLDDEATKRGKNGEAPLLKEAFTFHDLRAKSGSDAEDVQEANDRLADISHWQDISLCLRYFTAESLLDTCNLFVLID
jgi:hypothetical protein